jgi:uncharacterized OB-fold protein
MTNRIPLKEDLFITGAEGETLQGSKCSACGQVHFPVSDLCLNCHEGSVQSIPLSRRGRLYSFTTVHMPATNFQPPHASGFVDLPDGVRIFGPLQISDEHPFRVGMDMEVRIVPLWKRDEREVMGFRFVPV